jgi:thioredoxin 1
MSVIEINNREDFIRALKANSIVVIEYYDPENEESTKFDKVVKKLTKYADPRILFLKININRNPELGGGVKELPCLRVYYRGKIIFEQKGSFGKEDLDLHVLRRSIRSVFHGFNISFKI